MPDFESEARLQRKRDEFEKALKLYRHDLKQWVRYAQLEIDAGKFARARSLFERALSVDYTSPMLWLRYAQFEFKYETALRAQEVLQRGVKLLPTEDKLWHKYVQYTEDPQKQDELFHQWIKYSKTGWPVFYRFAQHDQEQQKRVLQEWMQHLGDVREFVEQAHIFAPDAISLAQNSCTAAQVHEIEQCLADTAALEGETSSEICSLKDSMVLCGEDIDLWWATLNLVSNKDLFEAAVTACLPPSSSDSVKTVEWRKYAELWLRYANWVPEKEKPLIFERALKLWPHERFSSVLLWNEYALYFVGQGDLAKARKVFGSALGRTKKSYHTYIHMLHAYLNMELDLANVDVERCRTLFRMLAASAPSDPDLWLKWAHFEREQGEEERATYILQSALDMRRELLLSTTNGMYYLWADMEGERSLKSARQLWEEIIANASSTSDAYMQYAMYELSIDWDEELELPSEDAVERARAIFRRGMRALEPDSEEFEDLRDYFIQFEEHYGDPETVDNPVESEPEAEDEPMAEAEEELTPVQKLLAKAQKWSKENA